MNMRNQKSLSLEERFQQEIESGTPGTTDICPLFTPIPGLTLVRIELHCDCQRTKARLEELSPLPLCTENCCPVRDYFKREKVVSLGDL